MGSGWAYFVEDTGYKEVLRGYEKQDEVRVNKSPAVALNSADRCPKISSCTGFAALDHADTKFSRGYAATGIGAVVCVWHEFWLALGIGDLQKGERYVAGVRF